MNSLLIFILQFHFLFQKCHFDCLIGSLDPRCATDILDCDKNPSDIRCNQVIVPLKCGPGFPYDVRCRKPTATKVPATFFPFASTTKLPTISTTRSVERPLCTFGSTNPECKKVTTNILTLKPEPNTTVIPITEPPITESTTFEPSTIRLESTTTPRLIPTTKQPITIQTTKTYPSKAPICYPGALDPRCLPLTTKKIVPPYSTSLITTTVPNLIISTIKAEPKCFPGMLNHIKSKYFFIHSQKSFQNSRFFRSPMQKAGYHSSSVNLFNIYLSDDGTERNNKQNIIQTRDDHPKNLLKGTNLLSGCFGSKMPFINNQGNSSIICYPCFHNYCT